jgi:hypothetical protein
VIKKKAKRIDERRESKRERLEREMNETKA